MTRLVLALALAGVLAPAAAQAAPPELPELPCLEFYDPEHAESHFVCLDHFLP